MYQARGEKMNQQKKALHEGLANFPGRWLGGISLIVAPILLVISALLRIRFNFFFPDQLAAYNTHPTLMLISYSLFLIGTILLFPAVLILVQLISISKNDSRPKLKTVLFYVIIIVLVLGQWLFMSEMERPN